MITTKKGDKGQTTCGNKRVGKDDLLVEVIGSIDELQSILELVGGETEIIDDLSQLMGLIGCNSEVNIMKKVWKLEKKIEKLEKGLPELKQFLRFKNKKALNLNWVRTVCRRVERKIVGLSKIEKLDSEILKYFNRLSDYLFLRSKEEEEKSN
ncbi:MAG: ATP:cob(I)alamin adenosyltransferase [Candidatus Shapirobacteria bacterium]|nr:ATP:cob(I)alamin adenosyltransferase [Candidatus Shapirobacteria bacterium]